VCHFGTLFCIIYAMETVESFASRVKEEIASVAWEDEQIRSLLSAFCKINGHYRYSNGKSLLEISSENSKVAKSLYVFIKKIYGVNVSFAYTKGINLNKKVKYHILCEEPDYILGDLEVDFFNEKIPHNAIATNELLAAYISGAFMCCGSVNNPTSSNYHLEFSFSSETYARWFSKLVNRATFGKLDAKIIKRRNNFVVYLKKSDQIADLIILMKATESALEYENIRVDRDFSNIGNRLLNLDSANLKKTMEASKRQVEEIKYFVEEIGWDSVTNPKLKILMKLRLEHEDATLEELREMLSDELASEVSKSNINHMFRHIHSEYIKIHGAK